MEKDAQAQEILFSGKDLRQFSKQIESDLRQVELDSIQDCILVVRYSECLCLLDIKEADNLVSLHGEIRFCDGILEVSYCV